MTELVYGWQRLLRLCNITRYLRLSLAFAIKGTAGNALSPFGQGLLSLFLFLMTVMYVL